LAQTISNKIISVCKQELSILSISVSVHKPNTELSQFSDDIVVTYNEEFK